MNKEVATFAGGCFWGIEEIFRTLPGVLETRVGYTGGNVANPTYEKVCTGSTGHAEAVEITFDPDQISYYTLLKKFWESHDGTQINRQGPDIGTQYRSAIFYHNEEQKNLAETMRHDLIQSGSPIATLITPAVKFYEAEDYHQKYFLKNGEGVCHI